jgi:hypothetical protein
VKFSTGLRERWLFRARPSSLRWPAIAIDPLK